MWYKKFKEVSDFLLVELNSVDRRRDPQKGLWSPYMEFVDLDFDYEIPPSYFVVGIVVVVARVVVVVGETVLSFVHLLEVLCCLTWQRDRVD